MLLRRSLFSIFLLLSVASVSPLMAKQVDTSEKSKEPEQSITIYNQNLALIKETRNFDLDKGINHLLWKDLASTLDINSARLTCTNGRVIEVKEQTFRNDLLTPSSVLSRSIGKPVRVRHWPGDGKSVEESGTLVATSGIAFESLIKVDDRYLFVGQGQLELDKLPSNLVEKPQIEFVLKAVEKGNATLLLSYEAANLNWQCDYCLFLNEDQSKGDLEATVTLNNQSGLNIKDAHTKLIAGNVHGGKKDLYFAQAQTLGRDASIEGASRGISQMSFADYHLYTLPNSLCLENNETKRLTLFNKESIAVHKKYVFEHFNYLQMPPGGNSPVEVKVEFQNDEKWKEPMPAGSIRVFQKDSDGEDQLLGSNAIQHTASGDKVKVKVGEAFDLKGERVRVNSQPSGTHKRKDTFKVTFTNRSEKDVVITDIEHIPDLAVFSSELPFKKTNSSTYELEVKVPATGSTDITYNVEARY